MTHVEKLFLYLNLIPLNSEVYLCNFKGSQCAIKQIKIRHDSIALIAAELAILESIDHPRIVKLIERFCAGSKLNLIFEYVPGGTLRNILIERQRKNSFFPENELLKLFKDITDGVEVLHDLNVIHRDLKPDNILVDGDNRLKICDFGTSKILPKHESSVVKHMDIGTWSYMAPEIVKQKPYDKKSDVWSLGVILLEMAILKHPYGSVSSLGIKLDLQ